MRRCFREQADDQLLALEVREVRPESGRGELRRVTALAVRARDDDAPAELAGRGDPRRGGRSETTGPQARRVGLAQRSQAADGAQQLVRQHERGAFSGAAADHEGYELVVRKRLGATRDKAFARTHRLGPLADRDDLDIGGCLIRSRSSPSRRARPRLPRSPIFHRRARSSRARRSPSRSTGRCSTPDG